MPSCCARGLFPRREQSLDLSPRRESWTRPCTPQLGASDAHPSAHALLLLPYRGANSLGAVREYDDGVHLASAINLLHGQIAYRDFTFLQPPGITLALTPFALLGEHVGQLTAMALARFAILLISILTVRLVVQLSRGPRLWTLLVGGLFVISTDVLISERTVLLEPFIDVSAVVGAAIFARRDLSPRSVTLAGVVFGVGCSFKLFALVLPLSFAAALGLEGRAKLALKHLGAALGACALIVSPFVCSSPGAFWRDVVVTQIRRPPDGLLGTARLASILGMHGWRLVGVNAVVASVLVLTVIGVGVASRDDLVARGIFIALLLSVASFSLSGSFFDHYGAFVVTLATVLLARVPAAHQGRRIMRLAAAPAALALAIQVGGTFHYERIQPDSSSIHVALQRVDADRDAGCVFSDSVSLSIAADAFTSPDAACPGWIDGRGDALTLLTRRPPHFYPAGFRGLPQWQNDIHTQLLAAQTLLLAHDPHTTPEWSTSVRAYVTSHFTLRAQSTSGYFWQIWARDR